MVRHMFTRWMLMVPRSLHGGGVDQEPSTSGCGFSFDLHLSPSFGTVHELFGGTEQNTGATALLKCICPPCHHAGGLHKDDSSTYHGF